MPTSIFLFRRDLRLNDHPGLLAAAAQGQVLPLFVLDPHLWDRAGPPRQVWLLRSLRSLNDQLGGALVLRHGMPEQVVPQLAQELGGSQVHVSADAGPYGRERDQRLAAALTAVGAQLVRTGSPYAIGPGLIAKGDGTPYRVFTPFFRAWRAHGWPGPAGPGPGPDAWLRGLPSDAWPSEPELGQLQLPTAGEPAAAARWAAFRAEGLRDYATARDRADLDGTSRLSAALKFGEIHPRTLLADLTAIPGQGADVFRSELAWREFYADVLWHRPDSAQDYLRPEYQAMRYEDPTAPDTAAKFTSWQLGKTGFPFVDAGMRQLRATGWMHNRVRMVVGSFLVKDLHLEWQLGARYFMDWLCDGDLASNSHGWQWVAGSGTDASPYFRIFNPITQGQRFDPQGDYVRRWIPELAHLPGKKAHEPWSVAGGYRHGYPQRIVDHGQERLESLARFAELKNR